MRLGIFAKTFARPTVEDVFDAVRAHGLRCVQFNLSCAGVPSLPDEIAPSLVTRIREAAQSREVNTRCHSLQLTPSPFTTWIWGKGYSCAPA